MRHFPLLLLVPLAGCMSSVHIRYLESAAVALPDEVKAIAPIDRLQSDPSSMALRQAAALLSEAPRFTVVDTGAAQNAYNAAQATLNQPLDHLATASICAATNTSGILSLEKMQIDGDWAYAEGTVQKTETVTTTDSSGNSSQQEVTRNVPVVTANFTVEATGNWKVYGCTGPVIDHGATTGIQSSSAQAGSAADAKALVGETDSMQEVAIKSMANAYARRISPHWMDEYRKVYKGGSSDLKSGYQAALNDNWDRATKLWEKVSTTGSARQQARAFFNLAVAAEQAGDLNKALAMAVKAEEAKSKGAHEEYVATLQARVADRNRLDDQMKTAPTE